MDRAERLPLISAAALMALFLAALVYSATRLHIAVPTCVTGVKPFTRGEIIATGDHRYEVHIVARMWAFDPPEVRLPPGSDVQIYLSALDVTHGLYIEHTNVNLMAVPGSVNAARVRFERPGEYAVLCHEYCGRGHHFMMGKFIIAPGAAVAAGPAPAPAAAAPVSLGEQLFQQRGCAACHSTDGSPGVGPTMKGLYGRPVELEDGTTRIADEAYIIDSIRDPDDLIVKGFPRTMPQETFTDVELRALVDYLKSLS